MEKHIEYRKKIANRRFDCECLVKMLTLEYLMTKFSYFLHGLMQTVCSKNESENSVRQISGFVHLIMLMFTSRVFSLAYAYAYVMLMLVLMR